MSNSATPRPWSSDGFEIYDTRGALIMMLEPEGNLEVARANAALIVQAVNAHEALVEACEAACRAIAAMENAVEMASRTPTWAFPTAQALIPGRDALYDVNEQLRAALALAKKGEK